MKTIIKNGTLVLSDGLLKEDILIEDNKILSFGNCSADMEYDADGCLVFPGFIDSHTHLEMDNGVTITADNFESGTKAAVAGGTTTILDFATQDKGGTLKEALKTWHQRANGKCSCNYGFHMAITDWNESVKQELPFMTQEGITSYKVYMAYDALRLSDSEIYDVLKSVKEQEGIVGAHCENGDLVNSLIKDNLNNKNTSPKYHSLSRPDYIEEEAVGRYIAIAKAANAPINIVHLSTKKGLERILAARNNNQIVYIETCPQYLTLTDEVYELDNFEAAKYVCSPPIRKECDKTSLLNAIKYGYIDTISTDHCSFNFAVQKELGKNDFSKIPNGLAGIEHRPSIFYTACVHSGLCTVTDMAKLLSENPAKLFGMYPQKGVLQPGSDADITIINTNTTSEISYKNQIQNVDHTPWEGYECKCNIKAVFVNGKLASENGKIVNPYLGEYVFRGKSNL